MGKPVLKRSTHSSNSDPIGDLFKKAGSTIKDTFTSDKAMAGYKTATNIAIGVASLTPVGKGLAQAAIAISDKATGGKATAYLGPQNSTLNMAPGGYLVQSILKETDHHAQETLNKYDPKKAVMNDAKTIGKTAVTHPSSTLSVASSVTHKSITGAKQSLLAPASTNSTIHQLVPSVHKPDIFGTPPAPKVPLPPAHRENTLQPRSMHSNITPVVSHSMHSTPSTIASMHSTPSTIASISEPLSMNTPYVPQSTIQAPASATIIQESSSVSTGSSSMMIPIGCGVLVILFLMMRR